jgi:hypothetical protein
MIAQRKPRALVVVLFVLTVAQLLVATFVPGLDQFAGKGFAARLAAYPAMMLVAPALWWLLAGRAEPPWAAFAWIELPFLVDVTGNTLDLYDSISWWDDVNHLVNWLFLGLGVGLILTRNLRRPAWEVGLLVAGAGAIMAIGWEVGEYFAFIRGGTELDTAYTDTLGDEALGTVGALLAGLILARQIRQVEQLKQPRG